MKVTVKVMRKSLCLHQKQEDLRVACIRKREKALKISKNVSMPSQKQQHKDQNKNVMGGYLKQVVKQKKEEFGVSVNIYVDTIGVKSNEGISLLLTLALVCHCTVLNWPWLNFVFRWERFTSLLLATKQ